MWRLDVEGDKAREDFKVGDIPRHVSLPIQKSRYPLPIYASEDI